MADGKFALKSGVDYLEHYNWEMGMNDDLAYSDRAGWPTSVEMLTGGVAQDWTVFGSLEVGNQYDLDAMGETRKKTTFADAEPNVDGDHIGMVSAEVGAGMQDNASYVTTTGGKKMATGPQNYNRVGISKKGAD